MRRDPDVLYQERSSWPWWVHLLVSLVLIAAVIPILELVRGNVGSGTGGMSALEAGLMMAVGVGLPASIYLLFGDLRLRVTRRAVDVRWGWSELIRKRVRLADIQRVEAVRYSPLAEFGGWGIRKGRRGAWAWTIRGDQAVRMELVGGKVFYLGSERPARVVQSILVAKEGEEA